MFFFSFFLKGDYGIFCSIQILRFFKTCLEKQEGKISRLDSFIDVEAILPTTTAKIPSIFWTHESLRVIKRLFFFALSLALAGMAYCYIVWNPCRKKKIVAHRQCFFFFLFFFWRFRLIFIAFYFICSGLPPPPLSPPFLVLLVQKKKIRDYGSVLFKPCPVSNIYYASKAQM